MSTPLTDREALIVAIARTMHECTSHPDYPDYDEPTCSGMAKAHCEMGHEHGRRGVCWCCEPSAAAIVDGPVAAEWDRLRAETIQSLRDERDRLLGKLEANSLAATWPAGVRLTSRVTRTCFWNSANRGPSDD